MTVEFRVDDEFAALVPPQTDEEFAQMEANCLTAKMVEDPLIVWKGHGLLIDGHHRARIAHEHGLPFTAKEREFPSREAVMRWMICRALGCRSLTTFARTELALKLKPLIEAEAKQRKESGEAGGVRLNSRQGRTDEIIGKKANVSANTVRQVEATLAKADEPTKAAARAGTISINAAHKAATAPPPKPADPPVLVDEVGKPIPDIESVRDAFARAGEIQQCMTMVTRLKSAVLAAASAKGTAVWSRLKVSQFEADCNHCFGTLKACKPFAVCPYCTGGERGGGSNCTACDGTGWLTTFEYRAVPKEMR